MACKKCGDPEVADHYRCHACDVVTDRFKWCVITKMSESKEDGAGGWYDATIDFKDVVDVMDTKTDTFYDFFKNTDGIVHFRDHVFQVGEIIPISEAFGREMVAGGRKPGKWDIEYVEFAGKDYKKALKLAIKVSKDSWKEKTNLDLLEDKYVEKQELTDKLSKLRASKDPFKMVYGWIKQNHITLRESKVLLGEVFKHVK